jgi:hypothetical protein
MSGSKSGGVGIGVVGVLGGAAAAGAIIVVGGVVLTVSAAVKAYQDARERVRAQREREQNELRSELTRKYEEWKSSAALSEKPAPSEPPDSDQHGFEIMTAPNASLANAGFQEKLKGFISDDVATSVPVPDFTGQLQNNRRVDLVNSINDFVNSVTLLSSDEVVSRMKCLAEESDIDKAAGQAMKIKVLVNRELEAVTREQGEARSLLGDLPPDFPDAVRVLLQDVADGKGRMDAKLRELVTQGRKATDEARKRKAAEILQTTLAGMGYQVESIKESLFVDGGAIHFRNDAWNDGYCVNLTVKDERIFFDMQRDIECGKSEDEAVEQQWKSEFYKVRDALDKDGIRITDLKVHAEPGKFAVPLVDDIPIETAATEEGRKKRRNQLKR